MIHDLYVSTPSFRNGCRVFRVHPLCVFVSTLRHTLLFIIFVLTRVLQYSSVSSLRSSPRLQFLFQGFLPFRLECEFSTPYLVPFPHFFPVGSVYPVRSRPTHRVLEVREVRTTLFHSDFSVRPTLLFRNDSADPKSDVRPSPFRLFTSSCPVRQLKRKVYPVRLSITLLSKFFCFVSVCPVHLLTTLVRPSTVYYSRVRSVTLTCLSLSRSFINFLPQSP